MEDIKQKYLKKVSKKHLLNQEDLEILKELCKVKSYKKGGKILDFGEVENKMSMILNGIVHRTVKIDNKIITQDITVAGTGMCSLKSYIEKSPSLEAQTALSDIVDVLYYEKDAIEKLTHENHTFAYINCKSRDEIYLEKERRLYMFHKKNAYERFEFFMNTNKNAKIYLKEVPQHIVAEYLNLSPETLSRVKKKYFKKE